MNSPFSVYRTELTNTQLDEYFVQPHFISDITDNKPVIIIGERGSGKTTLLKYLSYETNKNSFKNKTCDYIGVYWRFDLNTVTAFKGDFQTNDEWEGFFGHYISTVFCYELCKIVVDLKTDFSFSTESKICEVVWQNLFDKTFEKPSTFEALLSALNHIILNIVSYVRNHGTDEKPRESNVGQTFRELCSGLRNEDIFKNATFYFLLDEYESLLEYQQKVINTFLKYSDKSHTFKICMRPKGFKTKDTLGNEFIREKDDYKEIDFTEKLKRGSTFKEFVKEVCKKRFEIFYQKNFPDKVLSEDMLNIESYLEFIDIDEEFKLIAKSKKNKWFDKYKYQIRTIIETYCTNKKNIEKEEIIRTLSLEDDAFKLRLNLLLLEKGEKPEDIINALLYETNKYTGWIHNYKTPVLYLLCYETQTKKELSGFDTIIGISGGVIRYFLELVDEIFLHAVYKGFDFNDPKPISLEVQREAINYVSRKRFEQLNTIPQYGDNIKNFVLCVGKIFSIYHRDRKASKIEVNHFSVNQNDEGNLEKRNKLNKVVKECVTWGVLIERKSTKNKSWYDIIEGDIDFFLHPIYAPYFGISWRKKQKTSFDQKELYCLFFGEINECQNIIKEKLNTVSLEFEKKFLKASNSNQLSLFEFEEDL